MVARSVVSFGVSTERGAVHAVALSDGDGALPDRLSIQRTFTIGAGRTDLARAVEAALEALAEEIEPDQQVAGVAVTYRDPAERRAIVTGLASGPWRSASMVSAKSAHLALARAMSWTGEFGHLLICEVVPGCQCFSLISPGRDRVVASISAAGSGLSVESMHPAVSAAWDQFEAAGVQPEAVVPIGSGVRGSVVQASLAEGFGVPVIPSRLGAAAAAAGAALAVHPEPVVVPRGPRVSRSAAVLVTAASVLAGGLAVGGVYEATSDSHSGTAPDLADAANATPQRQRVTPAPQPAARPAPAPAKSPRPQALSGHPSQSADAPGGVPIDPTGMLWGPVAGQRLDQHQPQHQPVPELMRVTPGPAAAGPSTEFPPLPEPNSPVVGPNQQLLFPGEAPPPEVTSPEFAKWWNNHWRLMLAWAAQLMPHPAPHAMQNQNPNAHQNQNANQNPDAARRM
ncbi:hypothetical protein [Nocardia macrotermitis]|uniref:DUF7159 domain-containing protein n=1 Tax=Nocardia macrotermitis TaxID=2585198 RepID=A0A7K0D352_9NOCA|nr:hypothetical protein [Nocardia macrotermitis]MQY20087.1 hypothetical protein [Nocardia macrotermitis]